MRDRPISEIFGSVGEPTDVFRPPLLRIAFGAAVMGVVGLLILIVTLLNGEGDRNRPADRIVMVVVSVGAMAVAVGIVVHGIRQRRLLACVCPEALVVVNRDGVDVFRWNEIVEVRETRLKEYIYFIPVGSYRAAEIVSSDGTIIRIDRNRLRRVGELIDAIQLQVGQRRSIEAMAVRDARLLQIISSWQNISEDTRARVLDLTATQNSPTQR